MAANNNGDAQKECRDFTRGVCNRGTSCKFFHSPNSAGAAHNKETKLPICKDFQNKGCDRHKCKFLHITQQEEEEYNMTGNLPEHQGVPEKVRALGMNGGGGGGGGRPPMGGARGMGGNMGGPHGGGSFPPPGDVCKDFLNGICQRSRCKFRHVSEDQRMSEMGGGQGGMYGKRRRNDYGNDYGPSQEEYEMLRRKITDLQRQVVDLRQMNDTLYEQNTRYRNQLRLSQPGGGNGQADPYSTNRVGYPASATGGNSNYDGYSKF